MRLAALALGLVGCGDPAGIGGVAPTPVVEMLLLAGDSIQTASVEYGTPADSSVRQTRRPVAAADVALELEPPDGPRVPLHPRAGHPGQFVATLTVLPGATYRLQGSILDAAVSAEVTVPEPVAMSMPAADTVRQRAGRFTFAEVPYAWAARGASAYAVFFQERVGEVVQTRIDVYRDTTGVLRLLSSRVEPDTVWVSVAGYDFNATAFLFQETPGTSVQGAFGMFGAATVAARQLVVIWE